MNRKARLTRQRKAVLDEMKKFGEAHLHPAADEVYRGVKRKIPQISLATVYRNLEKLAEQGLIRKIEIPCAPARYNGNTGFHHHIRCVSCGRVDDVSIAPSVQMKEGALKISGYKVMGYRLDVIGLCFDCQRKGKKSNRKKGGLLWRV